MRQCTVKPAWIGYALKRRAYWEGQTRLIPSLFYMLSFHAFLKRKTVKRTLPQTDNIFSPQLKKTSCLTRTQISGISEKQRIKLNIFVNFLKKKNFFTLQSSIFFISIWSFEGVQLFWLELAIFYSKLLSATNQQLFSRHWKRYWPSNHIAPLYELVVSVLGPTWSFGQRPAEECTKNLADLFHCRHTYIR